MYINIGNDRLYQAVCVLVSSSGDLRTRVVHAMQICEPLGESDFEKQDGLREAMRKLREELSVSGVDKIDSSVSVYAHAAKRRKNCTYKKYAQEIFRLWMESCVD